MEPLWEHKRRFASGIVNLSRCRLFEVVGTEAKALKACDLPQAGNARKVSEIRSVDDAP
jgi:hypothetical protein